MFHRDATCTLLQPCLAFQPNLTNQSSSPIEDRAGSRIGDGLVEKAKKGGLSERVSEWWWSTCRMPPFVDHSAPLILDCHQLGDASSVSCEDGRGWLGCEQFGILGTEYWRQVSRCRLGGVRDGAAKTEANRMNQGRTRV